MDSEVAHILSGCVVRDISFSSHGCPGCADDPRKTTYAVSVAVYRTQHLFSSSGRLFHTRSGRETGYALAEASTGSSKLSQSASCTRVMDNKSDDTITVYKRLHWRRNRDGERAKMPWPIYAEEAQPQLWR